MYEYTHGTKKKTFSTDNFANEQQQPITWCTFKNNYLVIFIAQFFLSFICSYKRVFN